jgi:MFS family permease
VRGILSAFGGLFVHPGSRPQAFFGFIGRAPMAMLSVAWVAAGASAGGEAGYAVGGAAAGAYAVAWAVAGPSLGRLADHHGQRAVGRRLALISSSAALAAVVSLIALGPTLLLVVLAAVTGATQPAVGTYARVRWAAILESRQVETAQAFESIVDEATFLVGPAIVAVLATVGFVGLPVVVAIVLLLVGTAGVTSRHALPMPVPQPPGPGAPRLGWVVLGRDFPPGAGLLVATGALGLALGAVQVLQLAYCDALGLREGAALVYFVNSGASLIGAVIVGGWRWARPPRERLVLALGIYAACLVPSALVAGYWPFVVASIASGLAIAPTFIQANAVVAEETPAGGRTAAFGMLGSATGLGIAAGAAVAGWLVSAAGGDTARLVLLPLAVAAAGASLLARRAYRAAEAGWSSTSSRS